MSKGRGIYEIPTFCPKCNTKLETNNVRIEAVVMDNDEPMVRMLCSECGFTKAISKSDNSKNRHSEHANWAKNVKGEHPSCWICGSRNDLEAHHIIPVSHSRRFSLWKSNGITLCKNCHLLVHKREEEVKNERIAKLLADNLEVRYCSSCGYEYDFKKTFGMEECERCGCRFIW